MGKENRLMSVGQFPPNAFGLYDMHGNVWEWCQDNWHSNYDGAPTDGSAWLDNREYHVLRGGSWNNHPRYCRSAYRYDNDNLNKMKADIDGFKVSFDSVSAQYNSYRMKNPEGSPILKEYKLQLESSQNELSELQAQFSNKQKDEQSNIRNAKDNLGKVLDEAAALKKQFEDLAATFRRLEETVNKLNGFKDDVNKMKALSIQLKNKIEFWKNKYQQSKAKAEESERDFQNYDFAGKDDDMWIRSQINAIHVDSKSGKDSKALFVGQAAE